MSSALSTAAFQTGNDQRLRKAGLAGAHVWATLREGALELRGEDGGALRITPAEVARMRIGYADARRRTYLARIWRASSAAPLNLAPYPHTWSAYAQIMRGFAAAMRDAGRLGRIEGGASKFDALFAPLLTGLPLLGAVGIAVFALGNEPWWGRLLVPAIPLLLFALFLRIGLTRHWPLPLRNIDELECQLPPTADGKRRGRLSFLLGGRRDG